MDLGLAGRVYILTGASRGLGYATAQALVADGARVVLSARDEERLKAAASALAGLGAGSAALPGADASNAAAAGAAPSGGAPADAVPAATAVAADLGDPATPERLVDAAISTYGRLDGALVSVGGPPPGTALQASDDQWLAAFQTIFLGAVRMARTVASRLEAGGAIGLVLSTSVRMPIAGLGISNGLRPGLAGVVKDMADELGPRGIRVVGLLPHRIYTDRNRELFAATGDPEGAKAQAEASIPLRRLGDPEEFGRVAAFLLSPAASYLTGISVPVDGGALRML
ncbi:MAG TPA: SDR family oxidoreductase [Micromonosporaceae bacterium]|nr:SDR family oxidoreductase [Micromonosporaceae bacterium]